jgi:hypothetical protein
MGRVPLSLAVVGAAHPNKAGPTRRFEIAICAAGDPIELRPEPKNEADPHAIAVYSERGVQLGYLTAERAPMIGRILADGVEVRAVFQRKADYGAVIRVAFGGEGPVLPAERPTVQPPESQATADDTEFWPDPEWPD